MKKRRSLRFFWQALDSRDVIYFQILYYVVFCIAGIYGVFIAKGAAPLTLEGFFSHVSVGLWYWLNIIGPAMGLLGTALERSRLEDSSALGFEISGNVMFGLSLMAYMVATFQVESWGRGMYGAFPLATVSFASTALLVVRDVRWLFVPAAHERSRHR
jgi:hypothetical protein